MNEHEPSETGVIRLNSVEAFVEHSNELIKPAIRHIDILTTDMDKPWLGEASVVQQLKLAVVKNRRLHVRLLMADPKLAIRISHPLIPLIKRLSRFQAKVIDNEMLDKQPLKYNFVLVDRGGLVVKQSETDFVGFAHFDDKHSVANQRETFNEYWRYSHAHPDLRYMTL